MFVGDGQVDHGHVLELNTSSVTSRVLMKGPTDGGGTVNVQVGGLWPV